MASAAAQLPRSARLSGAQRLAVIEMANVVAIVATAASRGSSATLMAQPLTADAGTGGAAELIIPLLTYMMYLLYFNITKYKHFFLTPIHSLTHSISNQTLSIL